MTRVSVTIDEEKALPRISEDTEELINLRSPCLSVLVAEFSFIAGDDFRTAAGETNARQAA
jgi:hypothetical protein